MMLLVIDNNLCDSLKASLQSELHIDVLTAHDLHEAEELLFNYNDLSEFSLVINYLLLYEERNQNELIRLNHIFPGAIIARVDDEKKGLQLMKQRLITDFYVGSSDLSLELIGIKKAFRVAQLKKKINSGITEAYKTVREIELWNKACLSA